MHAEQLRHLIEHDHDADSRLEAGQHGLGDERGQKTEAQDRCQREQDTDHQSQRGRSAQQHGRIAVGNHQREVGPREDRDRRRGAHAQHARAAEHRVNHQRHQRGVEPGLDGQARDRGVGHGLRNDHRRRDEAGDDVRPQPILAVTNEPVEHLHAGKVRSVTAERRPRCTARATTWGRGPRANGVWIRNRSTTHLSKRRPSFSDIPDRLRNVGGARRARFLRGLLHSRVSCDLPANCAAHRSCYVCCTRVSLFAPRIVRRPPESADDR